MEMRPVVLRVAEHAEIGRPECVRRRSIGLGDFAPYVDSSLRQTSTPLPTASLLPASITTL
jgi:hypothetical protein